MGMLADSALLAVSRCIDTRSVTPDDRQVLARAGELLERLADLGGNQLVETTSLRAMSSLGVLSRTFELVSEASEDSDTVAKESAQNAQVIDSILKGKDVDERQLRALQEFFERLAEITLLRAEEAAIPTRRQRDEWIRPTSSS